MSKISNDFKLYRTKIPLDSKEELILEKNRQFFSFNRKYVDTMLSIINGESPISIRLLEWFTGNFSKKKNTSYSIKISNEIVHFSVYTEFKNQLKSCSKDYFDPFCRKRKLVYSYVDRNGKNKIMFKTSIGQLNFFQWAIRNRVIMYVNNHLDQIEEDMKNANRKNKLEKQKNMKNSNENPTKKSICNDSTSESDTSISTESIDSMICSSDKLNNICITPTSNKISTTESDNRKRRRQLSHSVFEHGIVKSNKSIHLDFD